MDSRNTENTGFQHDKKDGYKQSDLVRALEEAEDHLLLTDNEFSKTKAHALLKRLFDRVTSQETRLAIEEMLSTKNALRLKVRPSPRNPPPSPSCGPAAHGSAPVPGRRRRRRTSRPRRLRARLPQPR